LVGVIAQYFTARNRSGQVVDGPGDHQEQADSTNDRGDDDAGNADDDNGECNEEVMSWEEEGQSESQSSPNDETDILLEEKLAKVLGGTPRPSSPVPQSPSTKELQKPAHEPETEAEVSERLRILEFFG
jgi:hypothetical protein